MNTLLPSYAGEKSISGNGEDINKNSYDPRYQNTPVLKDDYFRALKEINPDGFDVFTIQ